MYIYVYVCVFTYNVIAPQNKILVNINVRLIQVNNVFLETHENLFSE